MAGSAVAVILLAIGGPASLADNLDVDTFEAAQTSIGFGTVACGAVTTRNVDVWVNRNGSGTNVYKNSSTVDVTATATGAGVTVSIPSGSAGDIVLPSNWSQQSNNTDSARVTATVTLTSSTAGAGSGSVTFTGTGVNGSNGALSRSQVVTLSWTTESCAPVKTATTTMLSCPASVTYTGTAIRPCTATTTGQGGFTAEPTLSYSSNTNAGTATATASYPGDATHLPSSDTRTFTIDKAGSSVQLTCPDQTYTGAPLETCTARATGVGGLDQHLTPGYSNNTDAGVATATATYAGGSNHTGSSATQTFTIGQAAAACTVTGYTGEYDGQPHGLTGSCTGVGGADLSSGLDLGTSHTGAGSHSVDWSFEGGQNYADQTGTAVVSISRAPSTVVVDCPTSVVFSAAAQEPCTATVTGPGGLDQPVTVVHAENTNAGTATATASYAGGPNHEASSGSSSFEITKAPTTATLDCGPAAFVYTGSAIEPCTASVTGPGLDTTVDPTYTDNVVVGTAGAVAGYAGTDNYLGSSDATTFEITPAPSVVTVTCESGPFVYDGDAHEPCTAAVTGAGGLNQPLDVSYSDNVDAGQATASASYAGDANHDGDSGSETFTIDKATSTVSLTCPASVTYDGSAQEPCTAAVTGAGGLDEAVEPVEYEDNVVVGTATARATYAGDANHTGDSDETTFEITRASSTTTVTCDEGPFVYTGSAITPCAASVLGAGGLDEDLDVEYADNTEAGTATASASYAGGDNHDPSQDSKEFVIGQADAVCTITGFDGTYDGAAHGLTGTCTGVGDVDLSASLDLGATHTDAGTYEVEWTFEGGKNYLDQSGTETVHIAKAVPTVEVTCTAGPHVYTGSAITPCSALVTGAGGLNQSVPVVYAANTDAGTASASAAYPGGANHEPASDETTFAIGKAPSSVAFICDGARTYTGSPLTPCSAVANGVAMAPVGLTVTYTDNTNAGTATAAAAWAGDANHHGSSGSTTFTVDKASSTVTVTCPSGPYYFTGSPVTPACTARATGANLDVAVTPVTFANNVAVGTATASASFPGGANHHASTGSTTFTVDRWTTDGFFRPVDMSAPGAIVWNTVKNGSTVPLKFRLFAGPTERTTTSSVKSFTTAVVSCTGSNEDLIEELATTGGTSLRYDTTDRQFVQNWQTPKKAGTCYKVTMTALDGSTISAYFKLK